MTPKQKGGFKIFPQVLLTMFLVSLIPLGGLWYINNVRINQTVEETVQTDLTSASTLVSNKVNDWLNMNVSYLQHSATLPEMTSMTKEGHVAIMSSLVNSYEWMESSLSLLPDGTQITTDKGVTIPRNFSDRKIFQDIKAGQPWTREVLVSLITDRPILALGVPVKRDGQLVGIWSMGLAIEEVSEAVAGTRVGETGYTFLVDDQNRVIAHGEPEQLSEDLQDFSANPVLQNAQPGQLYTYTDERGVRKVALSEALDEFGFTLVVEQNYAEAYAPLREAQRNALIVLAVTVLFVITVALLMARRLVKPIQSLTEAAEDMSRGQLGAEIHETERGDEIGALARAVERMGVSIKMAFEELGSSKA